MKRVLVKGSVLAAVMVLSGCMSSKRMMRISPLSEEINDELSSTNRTNTWPIYYHDNGMHSLLWPFIDWDQNGFAFRPIYNQEGSDKSVLWPLSGWNSEKGDGWVASGYWNETRHGIFPLYCHNPNNFSHYTLWWKEGREHGIPLVYHYNPNGCSHYTLWYKDGRRHGIPLVYRRNPDGFSHYGPCWTGNGTYGLFPLFGNLGGAYHVLNFYYDNGEYSLFPFFFKGDDEFMIPLLYNHKITEHRRDYSVLMDILFSYDKQKDSVDAHLFPFWFYDDYKNRSSKMIFPFYWNEYNKVSQVNKRLVFPFYYSKHSPNSEQINTLLGHWSKGKGKESFAVYPFYFSNYNAKSNVKSKLFAPFFYKNVNPLGSSFYSLLGHKTEYGVNQSSAVYPLYYANEGKSGGSKLLFPFYYQQRNEKGLNFWLTPLGGYGKSDHFQFSNILGPLYINLQKGDNYYNSVLWPFYVSEGDDRQQNKMLLPFYFSSEKGGEKSTSLVPFYFAEKSDKDEFWWTPLGGLGESQDEKKGFSNVLGPLYYSRYSNDNYYKSVCWPFYVSQGNKNNSATTFFPLYSRSTSPEQIDHEMIFNLGRIASGKERELRLWPFFTTRNYQFSEPFFNDFGFYLFNKYIDKNSDKSQMSVFGSIGYLENRFKRSGTDKISSHKKFLLFGKNKSDFYREDVIPEPLQDSCQTVTEAETVNTLLYHSEKNTFKVWRTGALTKKEMRIIARWLSKQQYSSGYKQLATSYELNKTFLFDEEHFSEKFDFNAALIQLLKQHGYTPSSDTKEEVMTALKALANEKSYERVETHSHFFPLYERSQSEGNYKFKSFLGLYRSRKHGDKERASFLKYLYRREAEDGNVRRDIFPFISVDSGENGGHSFLGKFWNFRKGKEGRYGNFLFIPWGKHPEDN